MNNFHFEFFFLIKNFHFELNEPESPKELNGPKRSNYCVLSDRAATED